ncbi:MAG: hypothetical protein KF841_05085 [Phycisphaerae bacterium]|nr:hypothetical protein [Phycisphaerae bacterium]
MPNTPDRKSLRELARAIFERWLLLGAVVVIATAGTWAYCRFVVPQEFRSQISLIFKKPQNKSPISADSSGDRALEVFVRAQQQIVLSDLVLARTQVISEDASLRDAWFALRDADRTASSEAAAADQRARMDDFLKTRVGDKVRAVLAEDQGAFDRFRESITFTTPCGDDGAMSESFTMVVDRPGVAGSPDGHLNAKYAADVLADMYIVRFRELQRELSEPAVRVMDDVISNYEKYVRDKLAEYDQFVQAHPGDVGVLEQLMKSGVEHGVQILLRRVRENDATLSMEHARDKAVQDVLTRVLPEKAFEPNGIEGMPASEVRSAIANTPTEFVQSDAAVMEIQKHIGVLSARKAKLETQFTAESREMRNVTAELDRSSRQMLEEIVSRARSLRASVEAREQQLAMNRELLSRTEREQNEIHRKLVTYARLKNEFLVAEQHLADLRRQQSEAVSNTLQARQAVTISKLSEASMPDRNRPVRPRTALYTWIAFGASALLGLILVFVLDHFDHTLRSSAEAERFLGLPVLGSIKRQPGGLVGVY